MAANIDLLRIPPCDPGLAAPLPWVMGIVNATPDSFSDGGQHNLPDAAFAHAMKLAAEGADILDIGGESTRPGASLVEEGEEIRRTAPLIRRLREAGVRQPISIDTMKAGVAEAALLAGANLVNDVTAGIFDPRMLPLCAKHRCVVILMHMQGTPRTMQDAPHYEDVVEEVRTWLALRAAKAVEAGCRRESIWIDPGFGFGKTPAHNCALVRELGRLRELGYPVVLGASRKSTLGAITGSPVGDREPESLAAGLAGAVHGASVLRVHEVGWTKRALAVFRAMT